MKVIMRRKREDTNGVLSIPEYLSTNSDLGIVTWSKVFMSACVFEEQDLANEFDELLLRLRDEDTEFNVIAVPVPNMMLCYANTPIREENIKLLMEAVCN